MIRQTKPPKDWNDVSAILGKTPVKIPRQIRASVDTGALARIRRQLEKDRAAGLLPPEPSPADSDGSAEETK